MNIEKLSTEEIRGLDAAGLRETEEQIRKELADVRMDIYSAATAFTGKVRNLRRSLARLMTVKSEKSRTKKS